MNKVLIGIMATLAATAAQAQTTTVPLTNANFEDINLLTPGDPGVYRGVNGWAKGATCPTSNRAVQPTTVENKITGNPGNYNGAIAEPIVCSMFQESNAMVDGAVYNLSVKVCARLASRLVGTRSASALQTTAKRRPS